MHPPVSPRWLRSSVTARALLVLLAAASLVAMTAARAAASSTQVAMMQEDPGMYNNPVSTLQRMRLLGVDVLRMAMRWATVAPSPSAKKMPSHFNASNPAAYPAANWVVYDTVVKDAAAAGIAVNFNVEGNAPVWALGPNIPAGAGHNVWEPSATDYGQFVHALGVRYSGNYDPVTNKVDPGNSDDLPPVKFWSIWNEPDYGPSLAPQGLYPNNLKIEHSPEMYRGLVDAAWTGLHQTGHGADTIIFGELAPRGFPTVAQPKMVFGVFSGMTPINFLRNMYCVGTNYKPLRGSAASLRGCPTTAAGSARFASQNPALFQASGVSVHPYSRWYTPNVEQQNDPSYTSLADYGQLTRALDRLTRAYHSGKHFSIYNTEYGYITSPPKRSPDPKSKQPYVSPTTAAYYLNWAEYISYKNPRVQSFSQFLLEDPLVATKKNDYGGYASGLLTHSLQQKPTYAAWRLPLYMPVTTGTTGKALEVWGAARPAHFGLFEALTDSETINVQFEPTGSSTFTTVDTVTLTNANDVYFDTHVIFPGSGTVRLSWSYPPDDAMLAPGYTAYSRHVQITIT